MTPTELTAPDLFALLGFLAAVAAAGAGGALFRPGAWYERLDKPPWRPPNWAFGPVWLALYLMTAISGWLVWRQVGLGGAPAAFALYGLNLLLNFAWSGLFFGLRRMDLALVEMALLWLSIAGLIALFAPISTLAAALLVPYLIWVSLAFALNLSILRRNPNGAPGAPEEAR